MKSNGGGGDSKGNKDLKAAVRVISAVFGASFVIGWGAATLLVCLAAVDGFYTNSWLIFSVIEVAALSWITIILVVWAKPKGRTSR